MEIEQQGQQKKGKEGEIIEERKYM